MSAIDRAIPFSRCRCRAFSLIETLIVLAIIASVNLMAWPTLAAWSARLRVEWAVHAFTAAVAFARSEAVRRGTATTICRSGRWQGCSSEPMVCHGHAAAGEDWRCGWIVVLGEGRDLRDRPAAAGGVLRRFSGVDGVSMVASRRGYAITYAPPAGLGLGVAANMEASPAWAVRQTGNGDAVPRRCVRISMLGKVRVEPAYGSCSVR